MDIVKLIAKDVFEAFSQNGRSGQVLAAEEFGISRTAVHLWDINKEIPEKRQLHLYFHRKDIVEKVKKINESPMSGDFKTKDAA